MEEFGYYEEGEFAPENNQPQSLKDRVLSALRFYFTSRRGFYIAGFVDGLLVAVSVVYLLK